MTIEQGPADHRGRFTMPLQAWRDAKRQAFPTCTRCPAQLHWVRAPRRDGKLVWHPLDVATAIEDEARGRVVLLTHFATCPKADQFREANTAPRATPNTHPCARPGCRERVTLDRFACLDCWRRLPITMRRQLTRSVPQHWGRKATRDARYDREAGRQAALQHWLEQDAAKRTHQGELPL